MSTKKKRKEIGLPILHSTEKKTKKRKKKKGRGKYLTGGKENVGRRLIV